MIFDLPHYDPSKSMYGITFIKFMFYCESFVNFKFISGDEFQILLYIYLHCSD